MVERGACVTRRLLALALLTAPLIGAHQAPERTAMTFFVTSTGRGFGGDLGGLRGADAQCQRLAQAAGAANHSWRAYLSAPATGDQPAVNARDRIGRGPWFNALGIEIASSVAELHSEASKLNRETATSEKGTVIAPGRHDILTGSNVDGTLSRDAADTTCNGWTSHGSGSAMLGHSNQYGGGVRPTSWNSAHPSRGCSQDALRASLGDGLFYCFAAE
jgi:hypothetical protein